MTTETKPTNKVTKPPVFGFGLGATKKTVFESLATLISAGIDISVSLNSILEEVKGRQAKNLVKYLQNEIESGVPFWSALEKARLLPDHQIAIIKMGEETGQLSRNLQMVMTQLEKDAAFKARIRSAMLYPSFVLIIMMVVGSGIAIFVFPQLAKLYEGLGADLPFLTRAIIEFSNFIQRYGYIAVPGFFLSLIFLFYILFINRRTRSLGHRILFNFSITHNIIQQVELAKFGYILGNLLTSGVPIIQAIRSLSESTTFHHYRKFYQHLSENILAGNSFEKSLAIYKGINKIMPVPTQHMLVVGEKSGNLPSLLIKIGEIYEKRNETTTKDLPVIVEPLLIIIVWVGVALLALAVLLPVYGFMGSLDSISDANTSNVQP